MAAKLKTGDFFVADIESGVRYFQYLGDDSSQLSSNIVRVFNGSYPKGHSFDIVAVESQGVEFFSHIIISLGMKIKLWRHVGHGSAPLMENVIFRDTNDYGNPAKKESDDWWIWRPNEKPVHIGPLVGKYKNAYVGIVLNPHGFVDKLSHGKDPAAYPAPIAHD